MATLKNLVDETTNIKNELKTCHANLKNDLIERGTEVSNSDKLSNLIDKAKNISYHIPGHTNIPLWYKADLETRLKTELNFKNRWIECTTKATSNSSDSYAFNVNGTLYHISTYGNNGFTSCYDSANDKWQQLTKSSNRYESRSVASVGSKIYLITGWYNGLTSLNECYDTVSNTWSTKQNITTARKASTGSAIGDKIYVIGGDIGSSGVDIRLQTLNQCYDTVSNTWSTLQGLPSARRNLTSAVVGDKIYGIGGDFGSNPTNRNECYDTVSNTWSTKQNMITARASLGATSLNGKIYAIGGWNGSATIGVNECYDPLTDNWVSLSTVTARVNPCVVSLSNIVHCIAGSNSNISGTRSRNDIYLP